MRSGGQRGIEYEIEEVGGGEGLQMGVMILCLHVMFGNKFNYSLILITRTHNSSNLTADFISAL